MQPHIATRKRRCAVTAGKAVIEEQSVRTKTNRLCACRASRGVKNVANLKWRDKLTKLIMVINHINEDTSAGRIKESESSEVGGAVG